MKKNESENYLNEANNLSASLSPGSLIRRILTEQCECTEEILPSSRLIDDLELESMALLTLITELENHYQAIFDISDSNHIQTIEDLESYIHTRLNERSESSNAN